MTGIADPADTADPNLGKLSKQIIQVLLASFGFVK